MLAQQSELIMLPAGADTAQVAFVEIPGSCAAQACESVLLL